MELVIRGGAGERERLGIAGWDFGVVSPTRGGVDGGPLELEEGTRLERLVGTVEFDGDEGG